MGVNDGKYNKDDLKHYSQYKKLFSPNASKNNPFGRWLEKQPASFKIATSNKENRKADTMITRVKCLDRFVKKIAERKVLSGSLDIVDYFAIKKQSNDGNFPLYFYPILDDKYKQSGTAKGHYFHQDLLVARRIYINIPNKHVDIGSRIDGFVGHVATFMSIEIIDIRNLTSVTENIEFIQANMIDMRNDLYDYCDSLSCLHALEHFGLGRYGDPIDFDGHLKGFVNMYNILTSGGVLYLSVPTGRQRIEFNAH